MRILADENIDSAMISWLRQQGHDVLSIAETLSGAADDRVLSLANDGQRILLTRDLDFGGLVLLKKMLPFGVISIRIRAQNQYERLSIFQLWWIEIETNAPGNFITVSNDRIRIRAIKSE